MLCGCYSILFREVDIFTFVRSRNASDLSTYSPFRLRDKEADAMNHWLSFLFELLSKSPPHHSPKFIDAAQSSLAPVLCHLLRKDETKGKPVVSFKIPKLCIQRCCSVANQMVRHFGSVPQMTSSIASIFHHLIIDPSVQQRIIPIVNSLNEVNVWWYDLRLTSGQLSILDLDCLF